MNLPLHFGWLGALEAGLIALLIGVLVWLFWRWLAKRSGLPEPKAIGWACVTAIVIGGGIDSWNLFYLGVAQLESPVYARIALSKMHDADSLGLRVLLEWAGALTGVTLGWIATRSRGSNAAD